MFARIRLSPQPVTLLVLVGALVMALLPSAAPVQAATAIVGRFYATCGTFAVDLAVNGTVDDGGGQDRFRFLITDGNNKKLYSEDSSRPINVTRGAVVTNVSFDSDGVLDGGPGKNPIKFEVIDLNNAGAQIGVIASMSYDAQCLPASGQATFAGDFQPPARFKARINVTTPLLNAPGGAQIGSLVAEAGKEFIAVYRSADGQWISIYVGSSDLPWIAAGAASVDLINLPIQPNRVDSPAPVVVLPTPFPIVTAIPTPVVIVTPIAGIPPTTVSALVRTRLRLRQFPSNTAPILTVIPSRTYVPVYGKDASQRFVKVIYNGLVGWVAVRYVTLNGATLSQLPIVQ